RSNETAGRRPRRAPGYDPTAKEAAAPADLGNLGVAASSAVVARTYLVERRNGSADSELARHTDPGDDRCENRAGDHRGEGGRVGQGSVASPMALACQPVDKPSASCGGQNTARLRLSTVGEGGGRIGYHGRGDVGLPKANTKTCNGKEDDHNGEPDVGVGKPGPDTKALVDRESPVPYEEEGYGEEERDLEEDAQVNYLEGSDNQVNYVEASDNEGLTLEEQLVENKIT
ncbi:hypothetical protein S245_047839, partial [Arachis hypogaea]